MQVVTVIDVDNATVLGIAIHAIVVKLLVIGAFLGVIIRLQSVLGALSTHLGVLLRVTVSRILRITDNPVAILKFLVATHLILRLTFGEPLRIVVLGVLAHHLLLLHELASRSLMRITDFDQLDINFLGRLLVARHGRTLVDPALVLDALQLSLLSISSQKPLIVLHLKLLG